ncbi:hypothetical protein COU15_01930 [Candidatus Kaiserbacteria bacterium CG10_big_fil_rev_8_21_14_0_10_45_20]|uniref:Methyltransferase type 11 domain-containing protein n=1 Tax=Candidatus Kaiserbacteria bacterium CG10_big_fil_rev_8_21_14_0_10_45_20 TaxID=1974607 RepID=A0A2H0UHJ4_9BACT|nr:MAG: hypothetical protein COU15_01930 [Candidatus Kaiserbacteria bacterium CG10_big_fil_rev_8_21_14_0_10_45_20]
MAKKKHKDFWNKEYAKRRGGIGGQDAHLALSTEPSEDLKKFTRFLMRHHGKVHLNVTTKAVDLGCGNGRNLLFLASDFGMRGVGYDTSEVAIQEAQKASGDLPVEFFVHSLAETIPLPDSSITIALDMMSSHVLRKAEREQLKEEVYRVLKPGGWLFFKSFLLEEDQNAHRLLQEHPGPEKGMYIHPEIGIPEYVWTEEGAVSFFETHFAVHKVEKSHKHTKKDGSAWKRRTITLYLEKSK